MIKEHNKKGADQKAKLLTIDTGLKKVEEEELEYKYNSDGSEAEIIVPPLKPEDKVIPKEVAKVVE